MIASNSLEVFGQSASATQVEVLRKAEHTVSQSVLGDPKTHCTAPCVGAAVAEGFAVGIIVGRPVGAGLGATDGAGVGFFDGTAVGRKVGGIVGIMVGLGTMQGQNRVHPKSSGALHVGLCVPGQ